MPKPFSDPTANQVQHIPPAVTILKARSKKLEDKIGFGLCSELFKMSHDLAGIVLILHVFCVRQEDGGGGGRGS